MLYEELEKTSYMLIEICTLILILVVSKKEERKGLIESVPYISHLIVGREKEFFFFLFVLQNLFYVILQIRLFK